MFVKANAAPGYQSFSQIQQLDAWLKTQQWPSGVSFTFPGADDGPAWITAIQELVKNGRLPKLEIGKVDGRPVRETPWAARLESVGFSAGYRGMTFRG